MKKVDEIYEAIFSDGDLSDVMNEDGTVNHIKYNERLAKAAPMQNLWILAIALGIAALYFMS